MIDIETQLNEIRIALREKGTFYEYSAGVSGFFVEPHSEDPENKARVYFRTHSFTSFEDDRDTAIMRMHAWYGTVLHEAGYENLHQEVGGIAVMLPSRKTNPSAEEMLAKLRLAVEASNLDFYTRLTPGRISIFVLRAMPNGIRRTEVFWNEDTGKYRAMPRFGNFVGSLHSSDLSKVVDFVQTELGVGED